MRRFFLLRKLHKIKLPSVGGASATTDGKFALVGPLLPIGSVGESEEAAPKY